MPDRKPAARPALPRPSPATTDLAGYEGIALDPTPLTPEQVRWTEDWIALCAQRAAASRRVHEARLVIDPNLMQSQFRR